MSLKHVLAASAVVLAATGAALSEDRAIASDRGCAPANAITTTVSGIVDGATIVIANGERVRLAGLMAPKSPVASIADADWPAAVAAREALAAELSGHEIRIAAQEPAYDRYGARIAHVWRDAGQGETLWINGRMIERGEARVDPGPARVVCLAALLAVEDEARRALRGLWALPAYRVLGASETRLLLDRVAHVEIVEGSVVATGRSGRTHYLNFGTDWRRDFTVEVRRGQGAERAGFETAIAALAGKRVRVRGTIERHNGPLIRLDDLATVEVLDGGASAAPNEVTAGQ